MWKGSGELCLVEGCWHELCLLLGSCLGFSEQEVSESLRKSQKQ
jgi:hypothetical protein